MHLSDVAPALADDPPHLDVDVIDISSDIIINIIGITITIVIILSSLHVVNNLVIYLKIDNFFNHNLVALF